MPPEASPARCRLAVDIGGTFTDVCCLVEAGGRQTLAWAKEPSTRDDPMRAVLRGASGILRRVERRASEVDRFLHGTTVATNAVLERRGARIGLLATDGFEDTLEMGRQLRSDMYALDRRPETPAFLAPGRRRRGVVERIAADGSVVLPLDEDQLARVVTDLVENEGVQALAVCYLFSFANPVHEQRTEEVVRELYPRLGISLSHRVDPVFREYERTCLTAFDAYLRPVVSTYLSALLTSLRTEGITSEVLTMQSRGGLASTAMAVDRPFATLLSGPAAGVIGAKWASEQAGQRNCITLDMGGTSADIALVAEGKPVTTTAGRIERYPLRAPMVDVSTIGAGGGSVAWLDGAGGLHVGPRSAGAEPGPACYGRGGVEPTVTDASVVLGYIDAEHFAGGLRIDPALSWRAITRLSEPLGLSVPETAHGIHRIVNAKMADEIRLVSVRRGYDPRDFTLVLFGGAGPTSGAAVATELGIRRLLVPFAPGALSAFGLLASPVEYDDAVTFKVALGSADPAAVESAFAALERVGRARLERDGVRPSTIARRRSADMRYIGQSHELEVPLPAPVDGPALVAAAAEFHRLHERVYGHASPGAAAEIVNLRTVHASPADPLDFVAWPEAAAGVGADSVRRCYFPELGGYVDARVCRREAVQPGAVLAGPVVIHQSDTTTVVPPGFRCHLDERRNLVLEQLAG